MPAAPLALAMAKVAAWSSPVYSTSLASLALNKVLSDATPIFGSYEKESGGKADATWNYSQATPDSLLGITDLNQVTVPVPETFRCQELSWIDMLNMGIRAFDLRYAFDPTNTTIIFYHSEALLSETVTLDDGSTAKYASNDAALQLKLYNTLTSPAARKYFVQKKNELGTLGEARGKITLMRRFDLDQLADSYTTSMPGLHFTPSLWTDNDPTIVLTYNEKKNLTAYIEDFYQPTTPAGSNATENIQWNLFWTWASSENTDNVPPVWPRIMAIGNGTLTPQGGVNQRLVSFLKQQKGKRIGIVMFDYFDVPSDLIDEFLSL
ncbi:uncharacterized protein N7477_005115 [Penicillium maclennaniae]|uniref:uncharacterized protein n=1 Tax=Penicillium maclennaniae TaxID=1343394 RepID=UPI00253FEFE5|nr:uncharacterized protein N7477_005115 [Penicillium maclennaniae]KAJ5675181.1 hypothetical protein N7477_005115 [Penicillium maclennaniae]